MYPNRYLPGNPRILIDEAVIDLNSLVNGANYGASVATITPISVLYTAADPAHELEVRWVPEDYEGGPTYSGFSVWGVPDYTGSSTTGSTNWFAVLKDDTLPVQAIGASGPLPNSMWDGFEAAKAGFRATEPRYLTGHTTYRFFIQDNPLFDNVGGISILVSEYSRVHDA